MVGKRFQKRRWFDAIYTSYEYDGFILSTLYISSLIIELSIFNTRVTFPPTVKPARSLLPRLCPSLSSDMRLVDIPKARFLDLMSLAHVRLGTSVGWTHRRMEQL